MKWAVLNLAIAGTVFLTTGWCISRSMNPNLSAVIPTTVGLTSWAIVIVLLVAWGVLALLPAWPRERTRTRLTR